MRGHTTFSKDRIEISLFPFRFRYVRLGNSKPTTSLTCVIRFSERLSSRRAGHFARQKGSTDVSWLLLRITPCSRSSDTAKSGYTDQMSFPLRSNFRRLSILRLTMGSRNTNPQSANLISVSLFHSILSDLVMSIRDSFSLLCCTCNVRYSPFTMIDFEMESILLVIVSLSFR